MNTRSAIDTSSAPVSLSVAFNQDNSCFAVGLDTGFCVFSSDPCELRVSRDFNGGIAMAEMLDRSNYVALVGGGRQPKFPPEKVVIWDDSKQAVALALEFRTPVHRVRLSRSRIVVVLQNSVHVYSFGVPPQKLSVFETADNPLGLCCLGPRTLAFPGRTLGQVQLVDLGRGTVSIIPAHSSPLRALELGPDGELLATASETGTLIRVFSTANCARLAELRRGVDPAVILALAISPSSTLLAVTSDKSTLHIFDLPSLHPERPPDPTQHDKARASTSSSSSSSSTSSFHPFPTTTAGSAIGPEDGGRHKWGILGKLPLMPRVFSDVYSFASAHFETGSEPIATTTPGSRGGLGVGGHTISSATQTGGVSRGRPSKGVLGWINDSCLVVVGAGRDGRWERFVVVENTETVERVCVRDGWRRYLGGG